MVAIVEPTSAGIGLCAALTVSLGAAAAGVLVAARSDSGKLRYVLDGPALVARGDDAGIELRLAGSTPALGCRLCLDRSSIGWQRRSGSPDLGVPTAGPPRLAPPVDGRLAVAPTLSAGPSARVVIPTQRRGVYGCRGLSLWLYDPLGFFGVRLARFPEFLLVVHPVPRATGIGSPPVRHPSLDDGVAIASCPSQPVHSGGGEVLGVRPYQVGDRWSSVHWRGLGKIWPLLVREFGDASTGSARLVLDDRAGVHHRASFEAALDLVVGQLGARPPGAPPVELRSLASGGAVLVPGGTPGPSLLRWLAAIEPRRAGASGRQPAKGPVGARPGDVVVTTVTGARSLVSLERGGVRLVVAE